MNCIMGLVEIANDHTHHNECILTCQPIRLKVSCHMLQCMCTAVITLPKIQIYGYNNLKRIGQVGIELQCYSQ